MTSSAKHRIVALPAIVLTILATSFAGSNPMTSIDPRVTEKLKEAGDHRVPVLIICGNACESVREALDKAGIKISGTESMVLGIISAELTADEVTTANSVAGVTYVEFDEEAKTLRNR